MSSEMQVGIMSSMKKSSFRPAVGVDHRQRSRMALGNVRVDHALPDLGGELTIFVAGPRARSAAVSHALRAPEALHERPHVAQRLPALDADPRVHRAMADPDAKAERPLEISWIIESSRQSVTLRV